MVAGKYRLEAIIGQGGMGSVWSATHLGLGQVVAIKFIGREFLTSPDAVRRFEAEARAAAQLRSRHVVQVSDTGQLDDGTPFIAMELLHGETLYTRIHRGGPVAVPEAVEIVSQAARALTRAHAAGIVHRDIKPDNIFLSQSHDDEVSLVKVLDFGIAKFALSPNDQRSTQTGAVLGTPLFMSPEQARGLRTVDHRTDLYSLGLVAYTMLTGTLAFQGESFGDLVLQICTAPLPSLRQAAPWVPVGVEDWFRRACAREAADRFSSAQEMADALRLAADMPLRAPSVDGLSTGPRAAGAPVAATTHAIGAGGTATGMARSGGPPSIPGLRTARAVVAGLVVAVVLLLLGVGVASIVLVRRSTASSAPPTSSSPPLRSVSASSGTPPAASVPLASSVGPFASASPSVVEVGRATAPTVDAAVTPTAPPSRSASRSLATATGRVPRVPSTASAGAIDLGY